MTPQVYVWAETLASMNGQPGWRRAACVGWPGEQVFHVRPAASDRPTQAACVACLVIHRPETGEPVQPEQVEAVVREAYPEGNERPVTVVVLALSQNRPRGDANAFVITSSGIERGDLHWMPGRDELYSRSRGLLEIDILESRRVVIVGLGSFGSVIAVELAKAGVGSFSLFDFDRVEPSNISRHVCGTHDLGRYKTHAVKDALLQKNPYASVATYEVDINQALAEFTAEVAASDLLICVTDENRSRLNCNQAAVQLRKVALFGRAITRAAGGDVFRVRPGQGPCLSCVFDLGIFSSQEEVSTLRQARRDAPAYVADDSLPAVVQVGLSSDIIPITNMVVKLALVELSRNRPSGIRSLEDDFKADMYIWANRRDLIYQSWPTMDYTYNRHSILRWYGAKVARNPQCLVCGSDFLEHSGSAENGRQNRF